MRSTLPLRHSRASWYQFRDSLDERKAAEKQTVDYVKLCEQINQVKNQKAKLRDVIKSEVEELQKQLEGKSKEISSKTLPSSRCKSTI